MKFKQKVILRYIDMREKLRKRYIAVRKIFLEKWTKIPEERRELFFSFLHSSFNYLQNALLLAVPIWLFASAPYYKIMLCIWFTLPFVEHYYLWFREKWKDDIVK